jgi:sugar phosphate isomerase/epimerase
MRLTDASVRQDAVAAIDAAIQTARVGMADRLGDDLTTEIVLTAWTANPSTSAERRRVKAALLEEKWVRLELMRTMPVLFQQAAGMAGDRWNNEDFEREGFSTDREIERLWQEILFGLDEITEGASRPQGFASAIGPDDTPVYRPGGSARPWHGGTLG